MKMIVACPNCSTGLRQKVQIVVSCPIYQISLDKTAIRKKSVQIEATLRDKITIYCPGCLWMLRDT